MNSLNGFVRVGPMMLALAVSSWATVVDAAPVFNANASVWNSSVLPSGPAPTVTPIGGSGQVNGNFVIDTSGIATVQTGLRANRRFSPVPLDNVGSVYTIEAGESSPGLALWNFDIHLDFGHTIAGVNAQMGDFDVTFAFDTNPAVGVSSGSSFLLSDSVATGIPSDTILYQQSWNMGFGFLGGVGFDSFAPGEYDFALTVAGAGGGPVIAESAMTVVVTPEPVTMGLFAIAGLVAARRKRRRA